MSEIKGTNIAAPVVPFTTDDQYPTHYARYGCGGRMTGINSIVERDAIPSGLRELNMEVPIGDTIWTLKKGLTNADWETVQNTGGISEPDADGKPYSRMCFPGQDEGEWVESTAKIPMRNGIEYTGTYYDVYMDAVNGDDNSVNPNNPATPLKTLDGAFAFITNRDFLGGYVRFRFKPGTYNISTLNNYITLSQFNSCGITQIYLQSELYINSSTYDETVILPKIGISNTIVGISVAGVKIRNTASGSVAILCNAPVSVSLYDCAIESNNTMISAGQGSGYISLTTVRFIPTVATLKQLMSTSDGSIRLNRNCSVENAVTVTNATAVSTGGTIEVNTGFTSDLNLVTGNKIDITGGGSIIYIGSIAGTDPASLIPGSTYGFNGRSTDFSNPDNLENAPAFITDGTGSAFLSDNGQYAPVVLEPTADGKPYMRVRGTGQEIGQWYESTAKIPMRKGIEYTGTYYDVYINATSGDDNSPNPNDPATPFRTINSLNGFLSVRDFYGGNVRIRLSSGNYEASYAATGSKFYSTRSLVNSTIGTLTITSESYITTPNNYYEDVIFPRLELAGIAVLLSGIRISQRLHYRLLQLHT